MCGIAGWLRLDGAPADPDAELAVRGMLDRLQHRGPDGQGVWRQGPIVLGHRRLSIIDVAGGAQPLSDEGGRVHIAFNGEIYNFQELREELTARGHRFRTRSDSEVLAAEIAERGEGCLSRLRGMFAFAAWDVRRRRLLVARDRVGKKPLYWAVRDGIFGFASELPALLSWAGGALDPSSLSQYLRFGYVAAPRSIVQGIHKLPAGSWLEVGERPGEPKRYWDLSYRDKLHDRGAARRELLRLVDGAVADRLISDVPVGAFLSGGIDSSLVVMRARTQLQTFTVGFSGHTDLDERSVARRVSELAGARHTDEGLELDASAILSDVVQLLGEPLGDPSALPTYLVARLAHERVKVVLTGDGGDETFAGYHRYARSRVSLLYRRFPKSLRFLARIVLRRLGMSPARLAEIEANAAQPAQAYSRRMSVFTDPARLLGRSHSIDEEGDLVARLYDEAPAEDLLDRLLYSDLRSYLAEGVLTKVDRMTMAHGIEARSPLLDHRIIELAARLPADWKRPPGAPGKALLREVAHEVLPQEIVSLPKRGFDVPVTTWMRSSMRSAVEEKLRSSYLVRDGWLDRTALDSQLEPHDDGQAPLGNRLWSLYVLELWYRQVMLGESSQPAHAAARG
jgi:asparagine synthase (glutamine-hydrolysing)